MNIVPHDEKRPDFDLTQSISINKAHNVVVYHIDHNDENGHVNETKTLLDELVEIKINNTCEKTKIEAYFKNNNLSYSAEFINGVYDGKMNEYFATGKLCPLIQWIPALCGAIRTAPVS